MLKKQGPIPVVSLQFSWAFRKLTPKNVHQKYLNFNSSFLKTLIKLLYYNGKPARQGMALLSATQ